MDDPDEAGREGVAPPDDPLLFRSSVPGDLAFVRRVCREMFRVFGEYETLLEECFEDPFCRTTIAEADGVPIGITMVSDDPQSPSVVHLLAIAVVPEWRRRGVGRRLLRHAIRIVRERATGGVRWMALDVAADNAAALALFRMEGFEVLRDEEGVFPEGQRSFAMTKMLE